MNGSVGWADVGILMPYRYAKMFGDKSILEEFYDGMARYARFMEKRMGVNHSPLAEKIRLSPENRKYLVNKGQSYGEWAEPEDVCAFSPPGGIDCLYRICTSPDGEHCQDTRTR